MVRVAFGRYIPRASLLHSLDPRVKVIGLSLLMASVFILNHGIEYLVMGSVIVMLTLLGRLSWHEMSLSVFSVAVLMSVSFFLQLAFTPGEVLVEFGPVTLTRPGLFLGLTLAGRLAFLAMLSALLGFTTRSSELSEGIHTLLRPLERFHLPVKKMALVFSVGLRFVPIVLEQGKQIMKAQQARGIDFRAGNLVQRAKRLLTVFMPLLSACLRRADHLTLAMDARGYQLDAARSFWRPLQLRRADWTAGVLILMVFMFFVMV